MGREESCTNRRCPADMFKYAFTIWVNIIIALFLHDTKIRRQDLVCCRDYLSKYN